MTSLPILMGLLVPVATEGAAGAMVQDVYLDYLRRQVLSLPEKLITDDFPASREEWLAHAAILRQQLRDCLGFPADPCPLNARTVGRIELDGVLIEKIIYDAEPFSSVTANLYLPHHLTTSPPRYPALIFANGHGGSKSAFYNQYAGQLYAKAGVVCLMIDTIGEEERHPEGLLGARGHRMTLLNDRAMACGRHLGGKMVYDVVRGIDYLCTRPEVDPDRLGCAGHSLGGTVTQYATAVDPRIKVSLPMAWVHHYKVTLPQSQYCLDCTRVTGFLRLADQPELTALAAPHCATLMVVGERDSVMSRDDGASATAGARETYARARRVYEMFGVPEKLQLIVVPEGGHRPYQLEKPALRWLEEHFGLPFWTADFGIRNAECGIELRHRPSGEVELGPWCDAHGVPIEPLYNTDLHYRKAVTLDVGVHILPPADLACLEPGGFKDPQFSITGFVARLEERYPTPFTVPTDRAAWERRAAEIKAEVRRLLHVPEATSPPEVREVRSFDHDGYLGVELAYSEVGWTTFLFFPDATSARRDVVIYVPASRDKTQGSGSPPVCSQARECRSAGITRLGGDGTIVPDYELTPRLARWLAEGKCMAVLDAGAFDDWETALGDAGVAVNTRHVLETFAVLRQHLEQIADWRLAIADFPGFRIPDSGQSPIANRQSPISIEVCSELRDVALYAGLAEEGLATIIAADGVPDGPRTPDRRAGLLPGIARIASHPELLAALAPRELLLTPDRETAAAWDSIRAVYALYGAADRVRWEE